MQEYMVCGTFVVTNISQANATRKQNTRIVQVNTDEECLAGKLLKRSELLRSYLLRS